MFLSLHRMQHLAQHAFCVRRVRILDVFVLGMRNLPQEYEQLDCRSIQARLSYAGGRRFGIGNNRYAMHVFFAHALHQLGRGGHHEYDPNDVCTRTPNQALN